MAHNGQSSRNRSTACTSEIDFPPTLLALADEVIELGLHQMLYLLTAGCGTKRR